MNGNLIQKTHGLDLGIDSHDKVGGKSVKKNPHIFSVDIYGIFFTVMDQNI